MKLTRLLAFALAVPGAGGQTRPGATADGGGSLSGIVRDITGAPLPGVDVTLIGETPETHTDSAGRFALRNLPAGNHTALFRRIGFASVERRWGAQRARDVEVAIVMTPLARQLSRVVVEASGSSRRRGTSSIGGVVIDSAGRAVDGAEVRLLGSGLSTATDSTGRFEFAALVAGSYIVRARQRGLASASYIMQIADADARGITLKMYGVPRSASARDSVTIGGFGAADAAFDAFDRRARDATGVAVVGPADLFRASGATMDFVLQPYLHAIPTGHASATRAGDSEDYGDCLLIDGRRATYTPLRSFTARAVQLVEVIGAAVPVDAFTATQMDGVSQCRGGTDRHPAYFILWTRALR